MTATSMPLWVTAQNAIVSALQDVSTRDAAINPALAFDVAKNLYIPQIMEITNKALVNVRIASITADTKTAVYAHKQNRVTFNCDLYCLGANTDDGINIIPSDENAIARLHYLTAQVEAGLTDAKNNLLGLTNSQIYRNIATEIIFFDVEVLRQSTFTYAPARISLDAIIIQEVLDSNEYPTLERIGITPQQIEGWSIIYTY